MTQTLKDHAQALTGSAIIALAIFLLLYNLGTAITDLKEWHGIQSVWSQEVLGTVFKQTGSMGLAAIGGLLFPTKKKSTGESIDPARFVQQG